MWLLIISRDVYGVPLNERLDSKGETIPLALTPAIQVEIEGRGITLDDQLSEINRRVDFEIEGIKNKSRKSGIFLCL